MLGVGIHKVLRERLLDVGLARRWTIELGNMLLNKFLQGSRRPELMESVARSVVVHVDGEGAMCGT